MRTKLYISKDFQRMSCDGRIEFFSSLSVEENARVSFQDLSRCELEEFENALESLASQIRDFRMKNFPESENIDE